MGNDVAEIKKRLGEMEIPYSQVALRAGVSKGSVGALFSGREVSDDVKGKILDAVQYLLMTAEVEKTGRPVAAGLPEKTSGFTSKSQQMALAVLDFCLEEREFSIITGASGVGKTFVVQRFAADHPGVLLVKMQDAMSYGDILSLMLSGMSLNCAGNNYTRLQKVTESIKRYDMLIVDEADLFVKGSKDAFLKKMGIFRECYEAGVAVALVGLPELEETLKVAGETYIYSRIGYNRRMKVETEELSEFWKHLGGEIPDTGNVARAVADVMREAAHRAWFRTVEKIYLRSQRVGIPQAAELIFG